jgi:hypothetical protein
MSNRPYLLYFSLQGTQGAYEASRAYGEPGRIWIGQNQAGAKREWRSGEEFEGFLPAAWRDPAEEARQAGHEGSDYFVGHAFLEAIRSGEPAPIDIYTALEWTAAGLCSQLSIANGGVPIKVPDFRDLDQRPVWLDSPVTP